MAWAIDIGGGNNRLDLASPIALAVGDTLEIRAKGKAGNLSGAYRLCGKSNEYRNLVELGSSYIRVRFNTGTNYDVSTGYVQPPIDQWFTFELERTSSTLYTVRLDGNVIGTINQSVTFAPNSVGGFYNSTLYGEIEYFRSGDIHLDPDASDRNNTGAQPVVVDTIGSNDATGYSMPTDGSVWVDLGGGSISVTEQIVNTSYTSNDPAITLTGTIAITENVVNTNYSAIDPTVTLTAPGVVSVTEQLVNVNYTSLNPVVTLTGVISITENLVNTNYTALNPVIDLTGLIDITEGTTNTNYEVNNPTITLTSGAIEIIEQAVNTQYQSKNPSVLLTPEPLGIVSTVCFNGCLVELGYNGTSKSVVFNGQFKELSFNGTIQTTCNIGSIQTNC